MGHSKHYFWSAFGQYGTQVLAFVGNVLIARVLSPNDYGLIAMLALVIGLANTFTDSGFSDCLIRKRDADNVDYGTISSFNVGVSLILYLAIYFSAPSLAIFFERPELTKISRLIGLSVIFRGLSLVPTTMMKKNLQFKSLAIMQISVSLLSLALTYLLALNGYGYWALACQPIFYSLLNILYLIFINRWIPRFLFNIKRFNEMAGFSFNLLISYLVNQAEQNLYSVIIGRNYPTSSLGYFNQAKRMSDIPTKGLNSVALTTSYPIIANESEANKQESMYMDLFKIYHTVQTIMVFLLIGVATPLWLLLLGEKWAQSVGYFNLFIITTLAYPFVTVNSNIIKINNKATLYRNLSLFRSTVHILFLIVSSRYSLEVILYGQIVASFITLTANMYLGGKLINFRLSKQLGLLIKLSLKPLTAFFISQIVCYYINFNIYLEGIIFLSIYSGLVLLFYIMTKDEMFIKFYAKLFSKKIGRSNRNL